MKVIRTRAAVGVLLVLYLLPSRAALAQITWSPPRPLAPDTAAFVRQSWHSVAARDTALWALWYEDRNTGQYLIKASRFSESAGAWLKPESVASDTTQSYFVETAVDADLQPWAVWRSSRFFGPESSYSFLYWSRRQGNSWINPCLITTDTTGAGGYPGVCADPEQGIWAVWAVAKDDSISTFSSYCRTDSWTPPALVDRNLWWFAPFHPVVTASPGGKVRIVWLAWLALNSATWAGDSWENREFIPEARKGYYHSVCSDSAGGTWVMWYDADSGNAIRCARHDGTGWTDMWTLATGNVSCFKGMLCCDAQGRVWAVWVDTGGISTRYFDGVDWSDRSVVAPRAGITIFPRITAGLGRVWVVWEQRESDDRWLLYYSHTQGPGVAGHEPQGSYTVRVSPSVVRAGTAIRLSGLQSGHTVRLLDAAGRSVELPAEKSGTGSQVLGLSTAGLSPGVYFVRVTGHGRPVSYKVLVVRGK